MLSKSTAAATLLMLCAACSVPWSQEHPRTEVNLAFNLESNLIYLPSTLLDGHEGRFMLATAAPATVVDPAFPLKHARRSVLTIGEKESLRFTPRRVPLNGVADAMIGADVWGKNALTIDYHSGLVTYQKEGIHPESMSLFQFTAEPMVLVSVDGVLLTAIVDTSSPDTLVIPSPREGRGTAKVSIAANDFGSIDVAYANVHHARIGNRLLSRFLVTIDYGKHVVGLWRDPRVAI